MERIRATTGVAPWSDTAGRFGVLSLGLAAVSVVAWIVFAAKVRAAGAYGGYTEGPWAPNWGVGLSLGVAVLAGTFSAATFVVAWTAATVGRAVEQFDRVATSGESQQA